MPPLLILAAVGAGTYLGVRWIKGKAKSFDAELKKAQHNMRNAAKNNIKDMPKLKKDPETGVYRVEEE